MYRELGNGHWLSDKIIDKEVFPVGRCIAGSITEYMRVDADTFLPFFDFVVKSKETIEQNLAFKSCFQDQKIDFSLFCHIYAFDKMVRYIFPNATKNVEKKAAFYSERGKRYLSEGISKGYATSNEFSVLAQLYFQSQDILTRYVGGGLVRNGDFETAKPHSFIVFQNNGKDYVYDPVNQVSQKLPCIAQFVGNKESEYLKTKNLFNAEEWYYSGGKEGDFLKYFPEASVQKIISKRSLRKGKKVEKQND